MGLFSLLRLYDSPRPCMEWYQKAVDLSDQISENAFLITYCILFDSDNRNLNHWKGELYAHCEWLTKRSATGMVGFDKRFKVLTKAFFVDEVETREWVYKVSFSRKMRSEGIKVSVTSEFMSTYLSIIDSVKNFIAAGDIFGLDSYIDSL